MRSPIQDKNAGAATDVAPTKRHAIRTAEVAHNQRSGAVERAKRINSLASSLGSALDEFTEKKTAIRQEKQYQQAFHEQGAKEGLSEYQKDLKRSGFTEFIYGGQSPEYLGALHASARNAANAMYIEEANFVEGAGGDLTPTEYQQHLQERITAYNKENFSDAPDAAFAFMKQWQDKSNEVTKQQVKLHQVREQEKARATVAEGFQTDLDVFKTMYDKNPEKAIEYGKEIYQGKYKPNGMSNTAYRQVLKEESFTAIRSHYYTALKLLNESGMVSTFNSKELKEYETVRGIIDEDNSNIMQAHRFELETVIESQNPTVAEVNNAFNKYNAARAQLDSRDTGSKKHEVTAKGSDRHRGILGNQWIKRLEDDVEARQSKLNEAGEKELKEMANRVALDESAFKIDLVNAESPKDERDVIASRLDDLVTAKAVKGLDVKTRLDLEDQYIKLKGKYKGMMSEAEQLEKDAQAKLLEAEREEAYLNAGVHSLLSGKGVTVTSKADISEHVTKAVDSVLTQINPESTETTTLGKVTEVLSNPQSVIQLTRGLSKFSNYVDESKELLIGVKNLKADLRGEQNPDNSFTEQQRNNIRSLAIIQEANPALYRKAFSNPRELAEITYFTQAMQNTDAGVAETVRRWDDIQRNMDKPVAIRTSGKDLMDDLHLTGVDGDIQNAVFEVYKTHLPLGDDEARKAAQKFSMSYNVKAGGRSVRGGGNFEKYKGQSLDQVIRKLSKSYNSNGTWKSGFMSTLALLNGGGKTGDGEEVYSLEQFPDAKVSLFMGSIVVEQDGRVVRLPREQLEKEIDGYDKWYREENPVSKQQVFINW